jgi:hypothetical protein
MVITYPTENRLLTKGLAISQLHQRFTCVHLSYSYLTSLASLFLFPFNTFELLQKHREAVCNPRLYNDCGRPTTIFYTALRKAQRPCAFTAHQRKARCLAPFRHENWGPGSPHKKAQP